MCSPIKFLYFSKSISTFEFFYKIFCILWKDHFISISIKSIVNSTLYCHFLLLILPLLPLESIAHDSCMGKKRDIEKITWEQMRSVEVAIAFTSPPSSGKEQCSQRQRWLSPLLSLTREVNNESDGKKGEGK